MCCANEGKEAADGGVVLSAETIGLDPVQSNSENVGNIIYLRSGQHFLGCDVLITAGSCLVRPHTKITDLISQLTEVCHQYLYLILHLIYSCFPSRVTK